MDVNQIEHLNINIFDSEKVKKQKCSVVAVNSELVDSSKLAISALSYSVICSHTSSDVDIGGLRMVDSPLSKANVLFS